LQKEAKIAKMAQRGPAMKSMSAKDAKNRFGFLLDTAQAEPVTIEKHGRPIAVVLSVEQFERLRSTKGTSRKPGGRSGKKGRTTQ
jgi:prevent-host-death family protein